MTYSARAKVHRIEREPEPGQVSAGSTENKISQRKGRKEEKRGSRGQRAEQPMRGQPVPREGLQLARRNKGISRVPLARNFKYSAGNSAQRRHYEIEGPEGAARKKGLQFKLKPYLELGAAWSRK